MATERFSCGETKLLFQQLEELRQKSGVSRDRAFEDFLTASVCALAGGTMEEEYLEVAKRYGEGTRGHRGIDRIAEMFGCLVSAMEKTRRDILGDLFEGAITYGESGQFLTPETICDLIARITGPDGARVVDPCCGSGRMLLAAADVNRNRQFVGQDIDLRCVRMTTINLALRNLYGHVLWGDSLRDEVKRAFRTGFNGRGFVAEEIAPGQVISAIRERDEEAAQPPAVVVSKPNDRPAPERHSQLRLF